jgi:hypothetical protein
LKKENSSADSKVKGATKVKGWFSSRRAKGKEKAKKERAQETTTLKIITFVVTLAAMGLAFSFIPLFPQPLPILLAVLIAFVTFKSPRIGMPVGTALIGVGLIYHLSELNFIALIGEVPNRIVFTVVWMALFVIPPIIFHRHKNAIAINLGIISAMVLFFAPIYFLAIPLILTSAVFFKKSAAFSIIYYAILSIPLQIVQYFKYILTIPQQEWWLAPGSSPPVFVPLNNIFEDLQVSMGQFRLFDTSKIVYTIYQQFTTFPDVMGRTLRSAFVQYIDSFPGIFLFIIIVVGIVLALIFFAKVFIKEVSIPYADQLFAPITAIITTALFFVMLNALHLPLAFTAEIDAATILLATLATAAFTVPLSIINYSPKENATADMIIEKAKELKGKLIEFENQLNTVKSSIPVNVSSPEGKMLIIKDKLDDILGKSLSAYFAEEDLDKIYNELNKKVSLEVDDLTVELNTILAEYQIFINCEYSDWTGKLKDAGVKIRSDLKVAYQKEMPLDERIRSIKAVLDEGKNVTQDVINTAEPIYNILRALYDPNLPEDCQVVLFAREKLQKQAPYTAINGLYTGLVNWRKQYGQEVQKSIEQLNKSLTPIVNLGNETENLAPLLGDKLPQIIADAKRAQTIKQASEKSTLNVLNLITLRELLDYFIEVSKDVLSVLYEELKQEEQTIEDLSPAQDSLWEKNVTLRERLATAIQELYNPKAEINHVMENLPKYLSYIDESVQTLTAYHDRKEFLLNYPMAEIAILEQLKIKKKLTPKDLPFETKYAHEYLRLFYLKRFSEYSFDRENAWLTKKE